MKLEISTRNAELLAMALSEYISELSLELDDLMIDINAGVASEEEEEIVQELEETIAALDSIVVELLNSAADHH